MFFSAVTTQGSVTLYCGDVHVLTGFARIRSGKALNGYQSGNQHVCNPFLQGVNPVDVLITTPTPVPSLRPCAR